MQKKVVIYTKPHCPQCHITQIRFKEHGVPYQSTYYGNPQETNEIDINSQNPKKQAWSLQKIDDLKTKYQIRSLPFVKIINAETGKILDSWTKFQPKKIDQIIAENNKYHQYVAKNQERN